LPYAVSAFFENGGRRAYVIRIVHHYTDPLENHAAVAKGLIHNVNLSTGTTLQLLARNEGAWGNKIRAALGFVLRPLAYLSVDLESAVLHKNKELPIGTLLRCHINGARPELRFVHDKRNVIFNNERMQRIEFSSSVSGAVTQIEIVEGELLVDDGELIRELHTGLGLSPQHPRWIANEICYRSEIVYPDSTWHKAEITPSNQEGYDRYSDLVHQDFFDSSWTSANYAAGDGVHAIATNTEVASVVIPDLYCPEALPDTINKPVVKSLAGSEFVKCVNVQNDIEDNFEWPQINQLCLDPTLPSDRKIIISLQKQLVEFADTQKSWVALLDVPPRLRFQQTLAWREEFNSSYVAAYTPWLETTVNDDQRNQSVALNPSAVAAGIIAAREISYGVHYGPANKITRGVVAIDTPVSVYEHDQFHQTGINVYLGEPGGYRLTAARTLSNNSHYRQLSVRRLIILIKRMLARQTQWAVFENNGPPLWRELTHMLNSFLLQLYRAGAFLGASSEEAFFVRCNEDTNTSATVDQGKLIAEIGIAPAEPMEFIVLRITLDGDTSTVREL